LSTINEKAATDVFIRDCMVYLGTCMAPSGQGKDGAHCADYDLLFPDGRLEKGALSFGELKLLPLSYDQQAKLTVRPAKQADVGAGPGTEMTKEIRGGVVGLLLDGRGRPLRLPTDQATRTRTLLRWQKAVGLYPTEANG
ncbi:MAG TPA: methylaspartate mutase, partial [Nitrospiraceae bacterium]|nr:methylaspartate mutase [Nitrospiraceae bacterium]